MPCSMTSHRMTCKEDAVRICFVWDPWCIPGHLQKKIRQSLREMYSKIISKKAKCPYSHYNENENLTTGLLPTRQAQWWSSGKCLL